MNLSEIIDLMNNYPVMQLATVNSDNKPCVRSVFIYSADENGIVFHTGEYKDLYRQMIANPAVEALFFNQPDQIQVRVAGEAVEIKDLDFTKKIVETPGREFLKPIVQKYGYEFIKVFKIDKAKAKVWNWETNMLYPKTVVEFIS